MAGRVGRRLSESFRRAPMRFVSTLVLGIAITRLLLSWPRLNPTPAWCIAPLAVAVLAGLRIDWTLKELTETRAGTLVRACSSRRNRRIRNDHLG